MSACLCLHMCGYVCYVFILKADWKGCFKEIVWLFIIVF